MRSEHQSTRAKTSKNRAKKQQSQPTCDHGSGNQTPAILMEGGCYSKNDDNENDSNDMKRHDLANYVTTSSSLCGTLTDICTFHMHSHCKNKSPGN